MNSDNCSKQIPHTQGDQEKIRTPEMKRENPWNITENARVNSCNSEIQVRAKKRKSTESDDGPKIKMKRFSSDRYDFRYPRYNIKDKQQKDDLSSVNTHCNFNDSCDSVNFNSNIAKNIPHTTTSSCCNNSQSDTSKDIGEDINGKEFQNSGISNNVENEDNSNYSFHPFNLVDSSILNLIEPPQMDEILMRIKLVEKNEVTNHKEQAVFFSSMNNASSSGYNKNGTLKKKSKLCDDVNSLPTKILSNNFCDTFDSNFKEQFYHFDDILNTGHGMDTLEVGYTSNDHQKPDTVNGQPNMNIHQDNNSVNKNENYSVEEKVFIFEELPRSVPESANDELIARILQGEIYDTLYEEENDDETTDNDETTDEDDDDTTDADDDNDISDEDETTDEDDDETTDEDSDETTDEDDYDDDTTEEEYDDDDETTDEENDNIVNHRHRVPRGLDNKDIELFPTRNFNISNNENLKGEELEEKLKTQCKICLEQFETNEILRVLPCFHEYHRACIDPWLKRKGTCPFCRCHVFDLSQ